MSFGGGSSGGTSTTTVQKSPQEMQLEASAMPLVNQFLGSYNAGNVKSPGQTPFTPDQIAAQNSLRTAAGSSLASTANNATTASNQLLLNSSNVNSNPALGSAIKAATDPITQAYKQTVLPGARTAAINAGGLGGTRSALVNNDNVSTYLNQIGNTSGQIVNNAYNTGLQAQLGALNAAPSTLQAQTFPSNALDAIGSEIQDQQTNTGLAQFQQNMLPLNLATQMFSTAAGIPAMGSTTTTNPAQPTSLLGRAFSSIFG